MNPMRLRLSQMQYLFLSTLLLICLPALESGRLKAESIHLNNGDRLTGTVVELTDGKLQVATPYAGNIEIDWSVIQSFET